MPAALHEIDRSSLSNNPFSESRRSAILVVNQRIKIASTTVRIPLSLSTVRLYRAAKTMTKSNLRLVSPVQVKRTVVPTRRPNSELRPREHLTAREVKKLVEAAK